MKLIKLLFMRLKLYSYYKKDNKCWDLINKENKYKTHLIPNLERELFVEERKRYYNQHCFVWCECGNELIFSNSVATYTDYVDFKCDKCGRISKWDFNAPAPFLLTMEDIYNDKQTIK